MQRTRSAVVVLLGSLLAAMAVAACSSGPDGAQSTDSPAGAAPTSALATPVGSAETGSQTYRLLLVEDDSLVVQDVDGTRRILASIDPADGVPVYPAWSPDGKWIAFVRRVVYPGDPKADWGDDVLVVAADGGEPRVIHAHAAKGELAAGLAWEPDGTHLLVGRLHVGFDNGIPSRTERTEIVEIEVASSVERTILDGGYDPSLSADGQRLAYLRHEESGFPTMMVANGDGSGAAPLAGVEAFDQVRTPRISPDGRVVAFVAAAPLPSSGRRNGRDWLDALFASLGPIAPRSAEAHGVPMDVWLADVVTGEVTELTFLGEDDPYLGWAPGGEAVVLIATFGLYEAPIGGTAVRVGEGRFGGQVAVAPN